MNSAFTRRVFTLLIGLTSVSLVGGAASLVAAQGGRSLSGIVRDIMGRPMAGVEVQLTTASGTVLRAETAPDGKYEFPGLGPGTYDFMVKKSGFKTDRSPLFLDGRKSVERNVKLSLGSISIEMTVTPGGSAAPPAAPRDSSGDSPRACVAKPEGGDILEPRLVANVRPIYPLDQAADGISAKVVMTAIVSKQGTVGNVRQLLEVPEAFATAATAAVTQWRYTPTLLNCVPIEVEMTVTVNFTIPKT